jgi:hypothetical protein
MRAPTCFQAILLGLLLGACGKSLPEGPSLSKRHDSLPWALQPGTHVPETGEAATVGRLRSRIVRGSARFSSLVRANHPHIVFKDEEGSSADRMMTPRLRAKLSRLSRLVGQQWPGVRLRVTEAWDERGEHSPSSLHYEGRAADLTTSDLDTGKLGRLARLAIAAGLDWVYYEDRSHVHVSVRR